MQDDNILTKKMLMGIDPSAEMPQPRVRINKLEDAEFVMQSEEHLVAETERSDDVQVGDAFLAIPKHICPTMALYDHVNVVESDLVTGQWKNAARHRLWGYL